MKSYLQIATIVLLFLLVGANDHYEMFSSTYVTKVLAGFTFNDKGICIVLSLMCQVIMICL